MTQTTFITQFLVQCCFQDLCLNMGWNPLKQIFRKHWWSHITTVNLVPQGLFGGALLVVMTKLFLTALATVVANHWVYFHWAFQSCEMTMHWLGGFHISQGGCNTFPWMMLLLNCILLFLHAPDLQHHLENTLFWCWKIWSCQQSGIRKSTHVNLHNPLEVLNDLQY